MAHRHVAERFAEQQKHGRTQRREFSCGNMSYSERTIYSYHWWPMARIIENGERKVALFRAETYSTCTCIHQNHVWWALRNAGFKIINVPRVTHENRQYGADIDDTDHEYNLAWFERRIGETLEQADRARVYRRQCMLVAQSLIEAMADYIDYFNLG